MTALAIVGAVTALSGHGPTDCTSSAIVWEVDGGFATLRPDGAARGDALLDAIARNGGRMRPGEEAGGSAYLDIVSVLAGPQDNPVYQSTWWNRATEKYEIPDDWLRPDKVSIRVRLPAGGLGNCRWSVDGVAVSGPCAGTALSLTRVGDQIRGTVAATADNGVSATECAAVEERLIIGLGDSYASGEGNPDQPTRWSAITDVTEAGRVPMPAVGGRRRDRLGLWDRRKNGPLAKAPPDADAQWWDNTCHRSLLSQQALAAFGYAAADRHRRVMFLSFACSGATIYDGIVGPRLETPGQTRPGTLGDDSPAIRKSQLQQLVELLCEDQGPTTVLEVPEDAPVWRNLVIDDRRARVPLSAIVPRCSKYHRKPDAILLTIGGNDVGFAGVGAWALLPPGGRLGVDVVPSLNKMFGGTAKKRGFGLVCPGETREPRCRLNTHLLIEELTPMFGMLDRALEIADLSSVQTKIQTQYPAVTRTHDGLVRGCLGDALGGERYELLDEPWQPAYAAILKFPLPLDAIWRWSFGITDSEMVSIDKLVLTPLNSAISRHKGWSIVASADMPQTHGICAADQPLASAIQSGASGDSVRGEALRQFGWPRYVKGGWTTDRNSPADWKPYAARARWVRTATDAALTQSVLDGGTKRRKRKEGDRLGEATSGSLHAALPLHAAMGELIALRLATELK